MTYNYLRPLAFQLNTDALGKNTVFTEYPFWVLYLPENLKLILRQAIARATNRSEDKVQIPVHTLNQAIRMLIGDITAITKKAGQANIQPWLYGHYNPEDPKEPVSSVIIARILRSWIYASLHPKLSSSAYTALTRQVTPEQLKWSKQTIDLTQWDLAENTTAKPYIANTERNNFVLLPDLVAERVSKASIKWGPYTLHFRRASLNPGQSGSELISWPPLEHKEGKDTWPFSVIVTFTLQTVPFQPFPELHAEIGIRRWAGPEISYLPGEAETSIYLLDQVPWIEDMHHSNSFQIAPVAWNYVPQIERKEGEGPYRLNWDSSLVKLLQDLHPKDVFPSPQEIIKTPLNFLNFERNSTRSSAALVFRNGIHPAHKVGPGLMPRDRYLFAEAIQKILEPEFTFIPAYQRVPYSVVIPNNPFFEKEAKKLKEQEEENENDQLVGTADDRRKAIAQVTSQITIYIRFQSEIICRALKKAINDLLGYPLNAINGYTWITKEIAITVESLPLGNIGERLPVKSGNKYTENDHLRKAIDERAIAIAANLSKPNEFTGVLIELDDKDKFDGDDPKTAIRIGFGRKGYLSQFITPQKETEKTGEKEKAKQQNQLEEKARSTVRDLLRQFGALGIAPHIVPKVNRTKNKTTISIPVPLHYIGFWLIKQYTKSSTTRIGQTLPVLLHMASNSSEVQVIAPGFKNWLPYHEAQINLLQHQEAWMLNSKEILQFAFEQLDLCLPIFGDTILFCDAQNMRMTWKWLTNENITTTLPQELKRHEKLRIVRLRTDIHEIPEWYAQSEKGTYGFSQGIFSIGDNGHVFASVQEKPPTATKLSKDQSKVLSRTKVDKKTKTLAEIYPNPGTAAWNPNIEEITVACHNPTDATMCAIVTNELRHQFASHFRAPTILPHPLHLASLLDEYILPLTMPTRATNKGGALEEEE